MVKQNLQQNETKNEKHIKSDLNTFKSYSATEFFIEYFYKGNLWICCYWQVHIVFACSYFTSKETLLSLL